MLVTPFNFSFARDIAEPAPTAKAYMLMDMQSGQILKSFEGERIVQPSSRRRGQGARTAAVCLWQSPAAPQPEFYLYEGDR